MVASLGVRSGIVFGVVTRRRLTAAAVALLPACSFLTDLDGFAVPLSEVPPDAAAPPPETRGDAKTDAVAPEAGGSFVCSRKHTLCEDFDTPTALSTWERELDPQGALSLATAPVLSPPSALHATLPRRPNEDVDRSANITREWPRAWARIVAEMDVYLEPPAWQQDDVNVALATLELTSAGAKRVAFLIIGERYTEVGTASMGYAAGPETFPTNRWVHVAMDLDPKGLITASFDGKVSTHEFAPVQAGDAPVIRFHVGLTGYNTPAPAISAYYDNVTFDVIE